MDAGCDANSLGLVVVSNRGPIEHHLEADNQIRAKRASGGLVTALSAFRKQQAFSWIASAITPGDRRVAKDQLRRRQIREREQIKRGDAPSPVDYVLVPRDVFHKYYEVFSNRFLWFLQHSMWDQLQGNKDKNTIGDAWWSGYVPTNMAFAESITGVVNSHSTPVIMLHDYHLYLAPRYIREQLPGALLQQFVHIPWPELGAWSPLPLSLSREICRSLLANDIVGFQTVMSAHNFLHCCDKLLEDAEVDYVRRTVKFFNSTTYVRVYPISVDTNELKRAVKTPVVKQYQERLRRSCGEFTIARVDRLDPSKNIARGFIAFEKLLDTHPDLQGKVKFLAFLVPSRTGIQEYEQCYREITNLVQSINTKFEGDGYQPIEVFYENNYYQALAGMSLCDVLLVNPLADGMNLVAKEGPIVSERDSVLVLSRTAGAFEQMIGEVLSIEAKDIGGTATALANALAMSTRERRERAQSIRTKIEQADISNWVRAQLDDIVQLRTKRLNHSYVQDRYTNKRLERTRQDDKQKFSARTHLRGSNK